MQGATVTLVARGPRLAPVIDRGPALPLGALVTGRPVAEVAETLPRLFNLCRMAQGTAARLSLGLAVDEDAALLAGEVLRDHLVRLCITLPLALGQPARRLPEDPAALWGRLPAGLDDLPRWLASPALAAPVLRAVLAAFHRDEAVTRALPLPGAANALAGGALENSPAGRQSGHRLMQSIARHQGRGPFWRVMGMVVDAEAAATGRLPPLEVHDGLALAPAARGTYALRLTQAGGLVTGISRATPTDHILAPGGALVQALSSLPAAKGALAPLVVALHDPCLPVAIREATDA